MNNTVYYINDTDSTIWYVHNTNAGHFSLKIKLNFEDWTICVYENNINTLSVVHHNCRNPTVETTVWVSTKGKCWACNTPIPKDLHAIISTIKIITPIPSV